MIDWMQTAQLRTEVGEEDFNEVIVLFFEEVEDAIARLPDFESAAQLGQNLHFLKGSAAALGFSALCSLCEAGELKCAGNHAASVDISQLADTYRKSKDAFFEGLPDAFRKTA